MSVEGSTALMCIVYSVLNYDDEALLLNEDQVMILGGEKRRRSIHKELSL